jgi:hypothetical protein
MGVNTEQTENNDPNQPNKFTGLEHNEVQVKAYRQMDLEELIKIMEQENGEGTIQRDKA